MKGPEKRLTGQHQKKSLKNYCCVKNLNLPDENQKTSYLSLTDDTDGISICYAINGVTSSMLSLTTVPTQQLLLLTRK